MTTSNSALLAALALLGALPAGAQSIRYAPGEYKYAVNTISKQAQTMADQTQASTLTLDQRISLLLIARGADSLRFRTVLDDYTLSADLPTSFVRKVWSGARYIRANVSGRNLLTFSKYKKVGYDPEVQQVAQSLATEMTWELWAYPPNRSFYFSVDVGF